MPSKKKPPARQPSKQLKATATSITLMVELTKKMDTLVSLHQLMLGAMCRHLRTCDAAASKLTTYRDWQENQKNGKAN